MRKTELTELLSEYPGLLDLYRRHFKKPELTEEERKESVDFFGPKPKKVLLRAIECQRDHNCVAGVYQK